MDSLKNENFDLIFADTFDFCAFLIAEKLGEAACVHSSHSSQQTGLCLPSPLSYVPVFQSFLTDHMDFWGRVKNFLMSLVFSVEQWQIHSTFDNTIKEHFQKVLGQFYLIF